MRNAVYVREREVVHYIAHVIERARGRAFRNYFGVERNGKRFVCLARLVVGVGGQDIAIRQGVRVHSYVVDSGGRVKGYLAVLRYVISDVLVVVADGELNVIERKSAERLNLNFILRFAGLGFVGVVAGVYYVGLIRVVAGRNRNAEANAQAQ